jgi:hypothetical protein
MTDSACLKNFACLILRMTYGDLRDIAGDFAAMVEEEEMRPRPKTTEDFANLLHDWAEAQTLHR